MAGTNKKRRQYQMQFDELLGEEGVFNISIVEQPAIQENFVALSEQHNLVELKTLSEEKRIICGAILVPDLPIYRMDEQTGEEYDIIFGAPVIERLSQAYLKNKNISNVTLEHQVDVSNINLVESWIVADSTKDKSYALTGKKYPVGTWMGSMKVDNNEVWMQYVKTGRVNGFSIEAMLGQKLIEQSVVEEVSQEDKMLQELKSILNDYVSNR